MAHINNEIGKILTPPKPFLDWCLSQIPTYEWKNKDKTILASTRKNCPIIKKRLAKNSRLTLPQKFYPFAIILVSTTRIEIQSYGFWHQIKDGKEILDYDNTNFERFSKGKHIKAHKGVEDWYKGLLANYGFMSGAYTNTTFYPTNWLEKLSKNNDMKYLEINELTRVDLAHIYKYRHEIEYLQCIKAKHLARQVMFPNQTYYNGNYFSDVDMKIMTKKWLKKHKAILKKDNLTFNEIMFEEMLQKKKFKKVEGIEKIMHYKQFNQLPSEVNLTKFQRYILKQEHNFPYYMDYLNLLKELKIPLNDDNILFPKELQKAHDDLVETLYLLRQERLDQMREEERLKEEKEQREREQAYQKRLKKLSKFEKEIDEFVFLVPKSLQEIINEGASLHHCVGSSSYLKNQMRGKTNIIFIRKKQDLQTPFFTLEYKNKQIEQVQGKLNREIIPSDLQLAINKWQNQVQKVVI